MQASQLALQLFTVRDALAADPDGTLRALAAAGYRSVELAGTAGRSPAEFRALLDAHGLEVMGAHVGLDRLVDGTAAALDELETLRCPYVIVPWLAPEQRGDYDVGAALGNVLSPIAEAAEARGMRLGYHNHDFEFAGEPGDRLWDGLMATLPPSVRLEVDVCWARVAGVDPVDLVGGLAGRVASLHLKDVAGDLRTPRIPGAGILPWRDILAAGDAAGVEWFVIEEDDPADALAAARSGYAFIRGFAAG